MAEEYVITMLLFERFENALREEMNKLALKYPQLRISYFLDFNDFKQSSHWGRTNVLVLHFRNQSDLDESLENNPINWVHSITSGVDSYIFSEILRNKNIILTSSKGAYDCGIAEWCITTMLYFQKQMKILFEQQNNHIYKLFHMPTLYGTTLVILGYGSIGKYVAKLAKGFGMNIIGIKQTASGPDEYANEIVETCRLHEVLPIADFLVMALPSIPSAENIIGAQQLSLMKKSAVLINVGRGVSLDEDALIDALTNGNIKGAALDAVKTEPIPPNSRLWDTPNIILSPHNCAVVSNVIELSALCFEKHLLSYLEGSLKSTVDFDKGY